MKNPFPGMNPYLEMRWHDVHTTLMVYMRDALNSRLPAGLVARVEEEIRVDEDDQWKRTRSDVKIASEPGSSGIGTVVATETATEPLYFLADELPVPRHIEIIDNAGDRVITAIELLSPTNKTSARGRREYWAKQDAYRNSCINLVEVDLLRDGEYVLAAPLEGIPPSKRGPYVVCVFRASNFRLEVYPTALREPLPSIRIPLRPTDADVVLPLQPLINDACERGGYGPRDYTRPLEPALNAEDAAWSESLLRESGLRTA